eukprot:3897289-Amphidinium_carterae.1
MTSTLCSGKLRFNCEEGESLCFRLATTVQALIADFTSHLEEGRLRKASFTRTKAPPPFVDSAEKKLLKLQRV